MHRKRKHGAHEEQDYRVTLADTGLETMTGARLKRVERYVRGDTFMVTYGDGVTDVNIKDVLTFHHAHGRLATVTTVRPVSRFGILDLDPDGRVAPQRPPPYPARYDPLGGRPVDLLRLEAPS